MAEKILKILIIFLLAFLIGCAKNSNQIFIGNGEKTIKINVEIADDASTRAQGLMFRKELDENAGMLFVFDDENYYPFWMKNTLIPLDIIFIGKNMEIVEIKNAKPCKEDPCTLYSPSKPAKYVLEVNGGFTARNSIKVGNKAILSSNLLKN